jgi:hypothetical protein
MQRVDNPSLNNFTWLLAVMVCCDGQRNPTTPGDNVRSDNGDEQFPALLLSSVAPSDRHLAVYGRAHAVGRWPCPGRVAYGMES